MSQSAASPSPAIRRARTTGFAAAALALVADQALKWAMIGLLDLPYREQVKVIPFFNFTWAENRGVSLGLLTAGSDAQRWALVGMTGAIALGVLVWLLREANRYDTAALGLVLGGALGNILDRVRLGYVVDYADLHFGDWRPFYIFNLADAFITCGVVILLARSLFSGEKQPNPVKDAAPINPVAAPEK
jgi:signal peptidase II